MLTRRYPRLTGEYFTYSYALVFTNRFWTLIMSGMLLVYFKPRRSHSTVIYDYCLPSISNLLSSWCQYEALRYVSFPAVTLFKSFKLAPVMLMGKLLGNYSCECVKIIDVNSLFDTLLFSDLSHYIDSIYLCNIDPQYDYIVAIFIGIGITMFMTSTDELTFDFDVYGEQSSAKWTGVMLLLFFLFFDSFTSQVWFVFRRTNPKICQHRLWHLPYPFLPLFILSGKVACSRDTVISRWLSSCSQPPPSLLHSRS